MKLLILFFLIPSAAMSKCYVLSDKDRSGNQRVQCTEGFVPSGKIQESPLDDHGKEVRHGMFLKEQNGEFIFDQIKKADFIEDLILKKQIEESRRTNRIERIKRIKDGCATATGLLKDICEEIAGG